MNMKAVCHAIALLMFALHSNAQTNIFAQLTGSPMNTTGWTLEGSANVTNVTGAGDSELILCPVNSPTGTGAVFFNQPINLAAIATWRAEFDMRIHDGSGADGLAFWVLDALPANLVSGQGLGMPANANGLKVCFDVYNNCVNDYTYQMPKVELRWGVGYDECNTQQPTNANTNGQLSFLRSPRYVHVLITYNNGNIVVTANGIKVITGYQQFNFKGYVGFSAGTGGLNDNFSIKNAVIYAQPETKHTDDSLALVDLYNSAGGPTWTNNTGWLTGPVTSWYGVRVGKLGRVTGISLANNGLAGSIPASLTTLDSLKTLNIAYNNFTFNSLEGLAQKFAFAVYSPQQPILANFVNGKLSVSAGGTLSNNTYSWYDGGKLFKTTTGDSIYRPALSGSYTVEVTNAMVPGLTLGSSPVNVWYPANSQDSLSLVDLYNGTTGANWSKHTGWLAGPVGTWYGITQDAGGRVTNVLLGNNGLTGSIPASLGSLAHLKNLALDSNSLSGGIPASFGSLDSLKALLFNHNQLSGNIPAGLTSLTGLNYLLLGSNQLTGTIPTELGNLVNLSHLNLGLNQLTGSIPASLGNLTGLVNLVLDYNQLSGGIPASLGNLTGLSTLALNHNRLTGAIPAALGNITGLAYLYLDNNQLTGTLPAAIGSTASLTFTLFNNYYTFSGIEPLIPTAGLFVYAPQHTVLPLAFANKTLSVDAGGTLSNNTYKWYRYGVAVYTVTGDSTFKPALPGKYKVQVSNAVAAALTLYGDTLTVTAAQLALNKATAQGQTDKSIAAASTHMLLYPNPVQNSVSIVFTAPAQSKYAIVVTDLAGRVVKRVEALAAAGINKVTADVHAYARGTYVITLTGDKIEMQSVKVVKQ